MLSRAALILSLLALFAPCASAQLRVGNLTNVLPQCQAACDAYAVMTTGCAGVGVYEITYIYCECTPDNFRIIEDCFNCQSVNATQEALMQALLDDIVNNCNSKELAPGSTVSISPQKIVPSPTSTNFARRKDSRSTMSNAGIVGAILGALFW
ncbi:hypothetical protein B0H15DRAFT_854304 [Mycena belliarum]|uniref:Extracellular membrane protein CFEM domain-containing protein n=1 Tax=Mycena belliarum TaxID=1033014 RepID=A0AAD6U1I2_9AGAR|nr:hypothetical protein B0H15DRAFT_854304 [Mycena belliae]